MKSKPKGRAGVTHEFVCVVEPEAAGRRIDAYLASLGEPFASRSQVKRLIEGGAVSVNGKVCTKASYPVAAGDQIRAEIPQEVELPPQPQNIPLSIVFEDDHIIVVNKARGMVVHPAPGNKENTLVNALLAHTDQLSDIGDADRPGIVHRLDKETSGLMVVAKTADAHRHLAAQLKARTMGRTYLAFVHGNPRTDSGTIDAPIGRHPVHRQRMAVVEGGREAISHYRVIERYRRHALLEVDLVTGRTHQIRVHLSYIGHPIIGDVRYGASKKERLFEGGQALHAWRLTLVHPHTNELMTFTAPLPSELESLRERLRTLTDSV